MTFESVAEYNKWLSEKLAENAKSVKTEPVAKTTTKPKPKTITKD